jgi:CopG family transcriptional regulator / antitoxin EndoAI
MTLESSRDRSTDIHLPDDTLVEIDRLAPQGDRIRFIGDAIQFYISETNKTAMRERLREGAIVRAERDLTLAQEWFVLDEEI